MKPEDIKPGQLIRWVYVDRSPVHSKEKLWSSHEGWISISSLAIIISTDGKSGGLNLRFMNHDGVHRINVCDIMSMGLDANCRPVLSNVRVIIELIS